MASHEDRLIGFFSVLSKELCNVSSTEGWKAFAIERQISRMRKRARITQTGLREKACSDFTAVNLMVGNRGVDIPKDVARNAQHFITIMLERFNANLSELNIQETLDLGYMFDLWRFGPGASNGIKGTHTAEKIVQPMSCTTACVPLVLMLRRNNPYFRLHDSLRRQDGYTVVEGSRLTTVPKNEDTERTIAIEPSGNMALQLAAGRYLEDVLRSIGLDITKQQPKNKALARSGSISNSLATIDLKSASDCISPELVRTLMPSKWFDLLMTLRSPTTELPTGETVKLNMISTMGNGYTFPLMTLIISSLIYGFRCSRGGPNLFIDWTSTAVFGDDIVIPAHEYEGFSRVLQGAGFIVNHDKSYSEGPFRESCGGDYYNGADVTPFYVKDLSHDTSIYVAINQVLEWSSKVGIYLFDTLLYLIGLIKKGPFFVPEWESPASGILTSGCSRRYKYYRPRQEFKKFESTSLFSMMLAIGGYIVEHNASLFFLPRPFKTRYKVCKGRLPRGYLSGWDPSKRSHALSNHIALVCSLLVSSQED
jgi:hypothetical protein